MTNSPQHGGALYKDQNIIRIRNKLCHDYNQNLIKVTMTRQGGAIHRENGERKHKLFVNLLIPEFEFLYSGFYVHA